MKYEVGQELVRGWWTASDVFVSEKLVTVTKVGTKYVHTTGGKFYLDGRGWDVHGEVVTPDRVEERYVRANLANEISRLAAAARRDGSLTVLTQVRDLLAGAR